MDPSTVLVQAIFETEGATGQADEQLAMQFTIADGAGTKYGELIGKIRRQVQAMKQQRLAAATAEGPAVV